MSGIPLRTPQVSVIQEKSMPGIQAGYVRACPVASFASDPTWQHGLVRSSLSMLVLAISLVFPPSSSMVGSVCEELGRKGNLRTDLLYFQGVHFG